MGQPRLVCVKCSRALPLASANVRCETCNEPFEVRYEHGDVSTEAFGSWRARSVFEQYAAFYPFLKLDPSLSLGEGRTSLVRSHRVAAEIGLEHLFFKNETENPTWTFKDRGTACSVQHATSLGFERVGTLSSGNMGASVAAFGRRAGMDTFVLLKAGVPREKIDAIAVYQINVVLVSGDYDAIYYKALEAGRTLQIYFSLSDEPMRVEGYKTLAFELFEQLDRHPPDFVAVPVGSGGLCRGIVKGFEELQSVGLIDRMPTMIGVQSEGCSPIADTYEKGLERVERFDRPVTLDHVLENPAPASGNELLRKTRKHGGVLLKVRNAEIIEAALKLAREGIFAQPASATALAGVAQCLRCGRIPVDARVVSIVTGSGLKYPSIVQSYGLSVNETPLDEVTSVLERLAASSPVSSSSEGASRV